MKLLLSLTAEVLHIGLMVIAAPIVGGALAWLNARFAGQSGPPLITPARELIRLFRKQSVLPEDASGMLRMVPVVDVGMMAAAATLVPSFTVGMALAPLSDLVVVVMLLIGERVLRTLATFDSGLPLPAVMTRTVGGLGVFADAAMIIAVSALGLMSGETNLDRIILRQQEGMLLPTAVAPMAVSMVVLAALLTLFLAEATMRQDHLDQAYSGPDLALLRFAGWLRRLVWIDLLTTLFMPIGMTEAEAGARGWLTGLFAWTVKVFLLLVCFEAAHISLGRIPPRSLPKLIGIAGMLALLGMIIAIAAPAAA